MVRHFYSGFSFWVFPMTLFLGLPFLLGRGTDVETGSSCRCMVMGKPSLFACVFVIRELETKTVRCDDASSSEKVVLGS